MEIDEEVERALKKSEALEKIGKLAKKYHIKRVKNGIGYDEYGNEAFREMTKEQEEFVKKQMRGWDSDINRIASGNANGQGQEQGQRIKKIRINKYTANGTEPLHESCVIGLLPKFVSIDQRSMLPVFEDGIPLSGIETLVPAETIHAQNPLPHIFDSEADFEHYL